MGPRLRYTEEPAERPEKYRNVPEIRLRGEDVSRMLEIFAVWEQMDRLAKDESFCRRCRAIPGGLRDLRMLSAVVAKLADALVWTIPQEKVVGFIRTLKRMRFGIAQGPVASRPSRTRRRSSRPMSWTCSSPARGKTAAGCAWTKTAAAASWAACWITWYQRTGTGAAGR